MTLEDSYRLCLQDLEAPSQKNPAWRLGKFINELAAGSPGIAGSRKGRQKASRLKKAQVGKSWPHVANLLWKHRDADDPFLAAVARRSATQGDVAYLAQLREAIGR